MRIERAGRALFAERGFDATTTRDIAAQASIGVGTLFVYFPQKRDLLVHLFTGDVSAVFDHAFATLDVDAPLVDRLMHVFGALYDYYERDRRLSRVFVQELMFVDHAVPDEKLLATTTAFLGRLGAEVGRAKERGELPHTLGDPEAAYHFFGVYVFNLIAGLNGMLPSLDQRWILRRALAHLVAGMKTPAA